MQGVFRIREHGTVPEGGRWTVATGPGTERLESQVALIHALIPLGLQAAAVALEAEVVARAGERDRRVGGQPGVVRWSHPGGSVDVADQKLPITSPRLRTLPQTTEVPLATAHPWQAPRTADDGLFRKIRLGVRGRHDDACAEAVPGASSGPALGGSLKTTTCLESVNAQRGQITDTVARWRTSDQQHRWVASARLTIEPRRRRITGDRHLSRLRTARQADIRRAKTTEHTHVAYDQDRGRFGISTKNGIDCCFKG